MEETEDSIAVVGIGCNFPGGEDTLRSFCLSVIILLPNLIVVRHMVYSQIQKYLDMDIFVFLHLWTTTVDLKSVKIMKVQTFSFD